MRKLIAALELQLQLLEELHTLLKRETSELSEIHLDAMAEIDALKEDLSSRMGAHAPILKFELESAATREGLPADATLGALAARLGNKGNRDIARLHEELNETAARIKELLNINREIAEHFAASVTDTLTFITRIINQTSTYGASGSYQQRTAGAVLINREA
jgi:flagellar biosynthesis/type III secretory pathway chaperone